MEHMPIRTNCLICNCTMVVAPGEHAFRVCFHCAADEPLREEHDQLYAACIAAGGKPKACHKVSPVTSCEEEDE